MEPLSIALISLLIVNIYDCMDSFGVRILKRNEKAVTNDADTVNDAVR